MINAFHKDYVKTHMPEFLSEIRSESAAKENGQKAGALARATRENVPDITRSLNKFPKTKARLSLDMTTFHIYARAGLPKGVK